MDFELSESSTPFSASSPDEQARRDVDAYFLQFLIDYAANDPECPPLLKAYLEEVVLKPVPSARKVEYHLRNPDVKNYDLGPTFLGELAKYKVFDQLYGANDEDNGLPSAPIPGRYQPRTQASARQPPTSRVVTEVLESLDPGRNNNEDAGPTEGAAEAAGYDTDPGEPMRSRTTRRRRASNRDGPSQRNLSAPDALSQSIRARMMPPKPEGRLARLLRRLQSIQLLSGADDADKQDKYRGRTGPDWELASWYKDAPQPPLAARLETIVTFLAEEDVDRCMNWQPKFDEVVSYLEWLAHNDPRKQLEFARPRTRAMFNDAVTKAKTHVLFEKHHYEPTRPEPNNPQTPPLRSTRLNWMINGNELPAPTRISSSNRSNLLPTPITPRAPSPVDRMPLDSSESSRLHDRFLSDAEAYWQRDPLDDDPSATYWPPDPEPSNLARLEAEAFTSFTSTQDDDDTTTTTTTGGVRQDPSTGQTILPDGTALPARNTATHPASWARECGARRAGLQQMLRLLPTDGLPTSLDTRWRRLVLPLQPSELRKICEHADTGGGWTPPRVSDAQMAEWEGAGQLETMPAGVGWTERKGYVQRMRELALLRVQQEGEQRRAEEELEVEGGVAGPLVPVALPRNLVCGGPLFASRLRDPEMQAARDLLRRCGTVVEVLRAALERNPRSLLGAVVRTVELVVRGVLPDVPHGVRLADDEWERGDGEAAVPKLVDVEDLEWLKFLAGKCVNSKNWRGRFVPDTPRDKYRLFLLFATRVQKLLDDKNPDGLFTAHDSEATVEQLLEAINAGAKDNAVEKWEFQPHDACAWLDRMKQSGHIRFRLDPTCYGLVRPPKAEYFPEDRVLWPTRDDPRERPSYYLGYIADWDAVIQRGDRPDINEDRIIKNFFISLAFRLGHTIAALTQLLETEQSTPPARGRQNLRASIARWQHICDLLLQDGDGDGDSDSDPNKTEPTPQDLALIRAQLIDELAANKTMLAPGRKQQHIDAAGVAHTVLVRDHHWDWAAATSRDKPRRQFFSVDRWPVQAEGKDKDGEATAVVVVDPATSDPTTDPRYLRPKLRPYGRDKTVFRPGPALFPVGDTRRQREAVEADLVGRVAAALGMDSEEATWGETLGRLNPFSRPSSRAQDSRDGGKLPAVRFEAAPRSWDPVAEVQRRDAEIAGEVALEGDEGVEGEVEFELPSVDVAMTGMGEPWLMA